MKSKTDYKPLQILVNSPDDIFDIHRLDISKAIIHAMKFGYSKRRKVIDFAELNFAGKMTVQLAIDRREFPELIEKNIAILEEFEEYELCAEALKLKQKIGKNKSKKGL
jgi:hypothetical protein